ncbi:MAG: DUF4129 domain-containing protein [Phycisphaera sp. RhM]|nr:DUF4129 domain-containing protein [Phycisphaera sp. RhM]
MSDRRACALPLTPRQTQGINASQRRLIGLTVIVLALVVTPSLTGHVADAGVAPVVNRSVGSDLGTGPDAAANRLIPTEQRPVAITLVQTGDAAKSSTTIEFDSSVSESLDSTPWYDPESRQLVPIELEIRQDDSIHRESRWLPKPKKIDRPDPSSNATNTGTAPATGLFGSSLTWGNLFGWVLLAVIVLGIVGITVYVVSRAELRMENRTSAAAASRAKGLPDEQTLERIKHLPPELRRTDVNLRTECERLMHEGRFDQAIILMLGHQLLLLDRNGLLRLSRGKTNGRYVRETRNHDDTIATWLRATADAFEQSYFGRHEISAHVFEQLWRQNEMLESATQAYGAGK